MAVIKLKSITGITSITTPAGVDNQLTLHTNNSNEAVKLDNAGNLHFSNHVNTTGVSTSSNFKTGSSNLHSTGLTVGDTFVHSTGVNASSADIDDFVDVGNNIKLGNAGVITATSFVGDGSDLTNLPAGLGTALSSTQTNPLNKMYYTNQVLGIGATVTVDPPASAQAAYTQYADIKVDDDYDLIIAEGDDLIPDVLGLADFGNFGGGPSAGRIRVNSITNSAANGAPTVQDGLIVAGISTFTGIVDVAGSSSTIKLGSGANRRLMYRSGNNDIVLEGATNFFYQQNIADTSHRWYTNGADAKLMISGSGAVMINTTNSSSRTLNLKGTFGILSASQTGVIDMSVTDAGEASIAPYVAGGSALVLKTNASGSGVTERLRIASDGRITQIGKSGSAANQAIDPLTSFLLNDVEARLQLCSTQSGSNASAIILSNESKHFVIHQRGPVQSNSFDIAYQDIASPTDMCATATPYFRINTNGQVTKPAHPSFYVRRSTGGDGRSAQDPVTEWANPGTSESSGNPVHNRGGHFNYTTGLFTAPVNGIYHFSAAAGYKQTNVDFNQKFVLNGGEMAEGVRFIGTPLNSHSTATISATCYMASGNTMGVKIQTTHHVNTTLNFFCGHLVA